MMQLNAKETTITKSLLKIVKFVDGDGIILEDIISKIEFEVRLYGIDAPEINYCSKIKKDEIILISIRFIGITMAKALITPTKVQYYEKINNSFFEGDYSTLSRWLGSDLDFNKVQNMLLGEALDDLNKGKFSANIVDQMFKLEDSTDVNTKKSYFFESEKYLIKKQQISQIAQDRTLQIVYPNYSDINQIAMPTNIIIDAVQNKGTTNITIDYNTITFNEDLSFPYSVPEGYEQIFIN